MEIAILKACRNVLLKMVPFSSHTKSSLLKTNTIKRLSVPLMVEEAIIIGSKEVWIKIIIFGAGWHCCAFTKVLL